MACVLRSPALLFVEMFQNIFAGIHTYQNVVYHLEPFLVSQSQVPFQDSHATHYIESLLSKLVLMSAITDVTVLLRICENVLTIDYVVR